MKSNKTKKDNVTLIIFVVVLVALLIIILFPIAEGRILYLFKISGNSMYPTMNHTKYGFKLYDVVVARNLTVSKIYCYNPEVRQYYGTYRYICHRLINIKNQTCYFKGDNNYYPDYPVSCRNVALEVLV